jgi:Domain of unknown function (DUF4116)
MGAVNCKFNEQMHVYKEMMCSLIYESENMTKEKKEQKKEKIIELAKDLFSIKGDDEFKKTIDNWIINISELKPGRKLIKALAKEKKDLKIEIEKSYHFYCTGLSIEVEIGKEEEGYAALGRERERVNYFERPLWIEFAHELVHALHTLTNDSGRADASDTRKSILKGMDNLEEQHTIAGFNHRLFLTKTNITPMDMLCENAFLLALNLPPRIDHGFGGDQKDFNCFQEKKTHDLYFKWLENELNFEKNIPNDKKENEEYMLKFLEKYPAAIRSLSEKLKNNEDFMLQLACICSEEFFENFPDLSKNKGFMTKATSQVPYKNLLKVTPPELFKDKEFVQALVKSARGIYKKCVLVMIDPLLKNDPDIRALLL